MTGQDGADFGPELAKYEDMAFQQLDTTEDDTLPKQLDENIYHGEEIKFEIST